MHKRIAVDLAMSVYQVAESVRPVVHAERRVARHRGVRPAGQYSWWPLA